MTTLSKHLTAEQIEALLRPLRFEVDNETPCRFDDCYACASGCLDRCTRRPKFRVAS